MGKYKNKDGVELSFTGKDEATVLIKEVISETIRILNRDDYSHEAQVLGIDKTVEAINFLRENFDIDEDLIPRSNNEISNS